MVVLFIEKGKATLGEAKLGRVGSGDKRNSGVPFLPFKDEMSMKHPVGDVK